MLGSLAVYAGDKEHGHDGKKWEAKASGSLSADEVKFVMKATKSSRAEAAMGELGQTAGSNDDIKAFAKTITSDHNAANEKLAALAEKNGVKLPEPGEKHKDSMAKLAKLQGTEFDKAFLDEMVMGHEKSVALFKDMQAKAANDDLKKFVNDTLPTLEKHLEKVKELRGDKAADQPEKASS